MRKAPNPYKQLLSIFRQLPEKNRKNLAWHAKAGTRICCGPYANSYTLNGAA